MQIAQVQTSRDGGVGRVVNADRFCLRVEYQRCFVFLRAEVGIPENLAEISVPLPKFSR